MNSIDFVKSKLKELVKTIQYIKCIYEFDEFDSTHYIKILPKQFYENDELYILKEEEIINNFIEIYPSEGIVFITENDVIDINNAIFEIKGMLYDIFNKSLIYNFADIEIFNNYIPILQKYSKINLELSENYMFNNFLNFTFNFRINNELDFTYYEKTKNISEENFYIDYKYSSAA